MRKTPEQSLKESRRELASLLVDLTLAKKEAKRVERTLAKANGKVSKLSDRFTNLQSHITTLEIAFERYRFSVDVWGPAWADEFWEKHGPMRSGKKGGTS